MVKPDRKGSNWPRSLGDFSRTRRARLVSEFEQDLGVDHLARFRAAQRARRIKIVKTTFVWTLALLLFSFALYQLWQISQHSDEPFSNLGPLAERIRQYLPFS